MNQKPTVVFVVAVALLLLTIGWYVLSHMAKDADDVPPPPAEVQAILEAEELVIAGTQGTTLRWIADTEDFVSVNLLAQSYGLGFMSKANYDRLESAIIANTTPEPMNNADSPIAGQKGFRVAGRACIIGFTYAEAEPIDEEPEETRNVYAIIVCSQG